MKRMWCAIAAILSSTAVWSEPTDYLVLRWSAADGLVSDYHQIVDLPPRQFDPTLHPQHANVLLLDAQGKAVGEVSLSQALITRAEFHGHDHIDGEVLVNEEFAFVVRAAQGQVDRLQLPTSLAGDQADFDFQQLVREAQHKGPQVYLESPNGGTDNRVNLLFMGDGYTSGQESAFNNDVNSVITYMLTFVPYQNYASFVSFDRLFTASSQSGADKPAPCFNPASSVNTAFDATFCTSNIQRLLTINSSKVLTAAAASPDWDQIAVIVNDSEYGGAGGFISTFSTNSLADDIFIHEYGHSFTGLADEYDTPFPGFPPCSDISGTSPCEANVTDVTVRNNIKWNYLIDGATPVPTPETAQFDSDVGLFEGARYLSSGMYRPKNACNMQFLGFGFCEVCQEAYVERLYAVPYANGGLLSLIEPDSPIPANPNPTATVSMPINFAIQTLQPTHDLQVTWRVGGVSQGSTNSSSINQTFQYTPVSVGMVEVKVEVKDNSAVVDPSQHGTLPTFEQVWQVDVQPFVDLIFADDFE
ncbi:M64 family metallopeptidase [Marinicella meishanensis]|uniref:M64 family metallopeptidase n=1 Tax=Marinicella meishanensis TaxID=2873263 RepID=UPI001CBAB25E|nr:M64 family metallopeptidase [Marinicella sp. NBU2979]